MNEELISDAISLLEKAKKQYVSHINDWPEAAQMVESINFTLGRAALAQQTPPEAPEDVIEALIKDAVNRFLGWKLPKDFNPDANIKFTPAVLPSTPQTYEGYWPVGTNLFTDPQATQMFRYALAGAAAHLSAQAAKGAVPDEMPDPQIREVSAQGFVRGWNACRKAMLAAAPKPDESKDGKV